jgi:ABC-type multidrug transport system ATPase subunit
MSEPPEASPTVQASGMSEAAKPSPAGTVARPRVFNFIKSESAAELCWQNLAFSVAIKAGRKQILQDISGKLEAGKLTCILGPSGSGKTSLLNILAGRVRKGGRSRAEIPGQFFVNGISIDPTAYQHLFGYVMQDDALLGTMTPREILFFSAKLRLKDVASGSIDGLLSDLLDSLGLTKCANTMVGNELIKGISGGERKRTSVGAELITNPRITFLDEPTSGLDTGSAHNVVSILGELTKLNQSVLCTIHQPSSEIFHLFDQAIFLLAGQVVFHGPPSKIREHFGSIGHEFPSDFNPADFIMFLIQTSDEQSQAKILQSWRDAQEMPSPCNHLASSDGLPPRLPRKGFPMELYMLSSREARNISRDKGTLGARFGTTIGLTLIYSLVFFRIGSQNMDESVFVDRDAYDVQSHSGAVTMLAISSMFGAAQPLLLTFASERPVFIREYASSMYGTLPYFLSKTVIEIPLVFAQNCVMVLIAYWLMAIQGDFFLHVVAFTMISLCSTSLALWVSCAVKDAKQGIEAAPALFVTQILFAGFFIKMELVPPFCRWIQYICSLKWGMNIVLINEFDGTAFADMTLKQNDAEADFIWLYFVVMVGLILLFRGLALITLSRKARAFYN